MMALTAVFVRRWLSSGFYYGLAAVQSVERVPPVGGGSDAHGGSVGARAAAASVVPGGCAQKSVIDKHTGCVLTQAKHTASRH